MRDRVTSKPRGFGFITFKDPASAIDACRDVHALDGRTIDVKPSVPQGDQQRPRSKKIFVGGLAPDTTDEQFRLYFERYGSILEAQIMVDHTSGRSRGFGFVMYEDEDAANRVFAAGPMHDVAGKQVEVKSATPKGSGPQGRGAAAPAGAQGPNPVRLLDGVAAPPGAAPGLGPLLPGGPFPSFPGVAAGAIPGNFQLPGSYLVAGYSPYGLVPYGAFPPAAMPLGGAYPYPGFGFAPGYGPPYLQAQYQQQLLELQQQQSGGLLQQQGNAVGKAGTGLGGDVAKAVPGSAAQQVLGQQRSSRLSGHDVEAKASRRVG